MFLFCGCEYGEEDAEGEEGENDGSIGEIRHESANKRATEARRENRGTQGGVISGIWKIGDWGLGIGGFGIWKWNEP